MLMQLMTSLSQKNIFEENDIMIILFFNRNCCVVFAVCQGLVVLHVCVLGSF